MTERPLRLLIIEDNQDDALFIAQALRRAGHAAEYTRVQTRADMEKALDQGEWDAILSDYTMPRFRAPEALKVLHERRLDIPFIVVSGSIGETTAVDLMRSGAHDYLLKDNLTRLAPVILREIQEAEHRRKRRAAEEELRANQARIAALNEQLRRAMIETHHRVKNNLQVLAAMLEMERIQYPEAIPSADIERLESHVRTMAIIHDILTREATTDSFAEKLCVRDVLDQLLPLMEQTGGRSIERKLEKVHLTTRQATALAMIANELVSNALKHTSSVVRVELSRRGDQFILTVEDNGAGFPEGPTPGDAPPTSGLGLVEHLVQWDLEGSIQYGAADGGGARVTIIAPTEQSG